MLARSANAAGFWRRYGIPTLVLIGLLVAWDFTKPRIPANPPAPLPQTNDRPNGGVPPWNVHEDLAQRNRDTLRRSTQQALDTAWSTFCTRDGHDKLAKAIGEYLGLRHVQEKSYTERWGESGRDYIARQWATADDQRIERLMQELYARGYLRLGDLKPFVGQRVAPIVKDTRIAGAPCRD